MFEQTSSPLGFSTHHSHCPDRALHATDTLAFCVSLLPLPPTHTHTPQEPAPRHVAVKEVVLPFNKFPGADTLLGPEMRSTGEVMGIDYDFASSYAKAQIAAGERQGVGEGSSMC